jgi:hypothetical protein
MSQAISTDIIQAVDQIETLFEIALAHQSANFHAHKD